MSDKKQEEQKKEQPKETFPESIAGFASVFVSGLFIITFVIQHFEIPSGSMEQTLLIGDHVFVDRLVSTGRAFPRPLLPYRGPKRGEITVFVSPAEPGLYLVKRIIAVPGDKIHLHEGKVYLNGVEQNEAYVVRDGNTIPSTFRDEFPARGMIASDATLQWRMELPQHIEGQDLVVPADHYFAMGDNRDHSYDSRYWGFIPRENIVGRPLFVAWSLNQTEEDFPPNPSMGDRITAFLKTTVHFFTLTRWNRVLRRVH
ncbi:MAG TPA: signal peptidase I [Candidatus Angelobacter sp.]|nr:signal peptidase I [Candidatus Angelobacter sp.]